MARRGWIALAGLGLTGLVVALGVQHGGSWISTIGLQIPGLALMAAGVALAGRRRRDPDLLLAAGLVWVFGNFSFQETSPVLAGIAQLTLFVPAALVTWVIFGLPGGRVRTRDDWRLLIAVAVCTCINAPVQTLLVPPDGDPVHVVVDGLGTPFTIYSNLVAAVVTVLVCVRLARTFRAAGPAGRRILGPVLGAMVLATAGNFASGATASATPGLVTTLTFSDGHLAADFATLLLVVGWTLLALAFFVAIVRSSSSAGAVGRLLPGLAQDASAAQLEEMLARATGDPTLRLELDPVGEPPTTDGRAATDVTFGEHTLARLHHDEALLEHPTALEAATAALGLLLGRRQLTLALDDAARQGGADRRRLEADLARVRDAFGAFVDPAVADSVLEDGWDVRGHEVDVTLFFLDVRGFTAWSEQATPTQVMARMNALWELVVPIVTDHGGHANKFIGDGLLAVFGAPSPCPGHAERALAAAEAIVAAIDARFHGDLEVGIGIHSGPVMAGTVGGGGRVEFTVIGDVVNTAARIESTTRVTGDAVLISAATRGLLAAERPFITRPEVVLKGKATPVALHAPVVGALSAAPV